MVTAKEWEGPQGVTVGATDTSVTVNGWTLTMTPGHAPDVRLHLIRKLTSGSRTQ